MSLKTINFDEIQNVFDNIEKNDYSILNLDYFYNYFDILSEGDLFYVIKFFNIFLEIKSNEEENECLNHYKLFIEKYTKSILEKGKILLF